MIQSITFGDKNTWDDWKILPTERPVFAPPKPKTTYIDIPGGNGTLDLSESLTGYPVYENRTGSFKFRVMNDYVPWYERYSEIMNYLHGRVMNAVLADEPNYFYNGRFTVDNWESGNTWSIITIGYNVNPYKWVLSSSTEPWIWDSFNFSTGIITDTTFTDIYINSPSVWIDKSFKSDFFGTVPISPTIIVSNSSNLNVRYVNEYLGIDSTIVLSDGNNKIPDFIFYGLNSYTLKFKGVGTVSIDFRKGTL